MQERNRNTKIAVLAWTYVVDTLVAGLAAWYYIAFSSGSPWSIAAQAVLIVFWIIVSVVSVRTAGVLKRLGSRGDLISEIGAYCLFATTIVVFFALDRFFRLGSNFGFAFEIAVPILFLARIWIVVRLLTEKYEATSNDL